MTKLSVKTTDRSAATGRLSERQHTEPQSSKSTDPKRLLAVSLNHLALSPWLTLIASITLGTGCTAQPGESEKWPRQALMTSPTEIAYVDDVKCAACHQAAYEAWTDSHHDLAMQPATPDTVRGNFNSTTFTHFGVTSRFFQRDERFFVNTEGPDGELGDFEVTYTFGIEPLQQYLAPFPGGRLQSLSIAWDTERNKWFHLYPDERIPPNDPLHWTGRYQNWNLMCAACHSTELRKQYSLDTDTYQTTWAAINVSCQACHGPGAEHLELVNTANGAAPEDDWGILTSWSAGDPNQELDTCAPCHSRREPITPVMVHGSPLLDNYRPALLSEGLYHPDGQVLDEVYVYGSFVQSKMHAAGVRCSNCHDPHSLDLRAENNGLCTQCHRDAPVEQFPMLEPNSYDSPAHHHHDPGTSGALCVNCHMPARTFMVVDPRRDHSFRVPRPDLSETLGTPNVCTECHANRTDPWAAETVAGWSETPPPPHFATLLAAGRAGQQEVSGDLATLAADVSQAAIVRATALELLRPFGQIGLDAARSALTDTDPLVRTMAVGGLESLSPPSRFVSAQPLLEDPSRSVRIEAVRMLAEAWAVDNVAGEDGRPLIRAAREYLAAQAVSADMPATHLNLGVVHQRQDAPQEAETEYRTALALDPWFTPARFNLATLLNGQHRNGEAETILRDGLLFTPDEGELHYSLGLLFGEEGRFEEAADSLQRAAILVPARSRVRYNLGLVLQQIGRLAESEAALLEARTLDSRDPDVLLALARLLMSQRRWAEARRFAAELVGLLPTAPGPQRLFNEIQLRERRNRR